MKVSEMTNDELNYAVAVEVMGWKATGGYYTGDFDDPAYGNWHPTESISDAWQVVEKMREKKFGFSLVAALTDDTNKNIWMAIFAFGLVVEHKSAPRAICEAALAMVSKLKGEI